MVVGLGRRILGRKDQLGNLVTGSLDGEVGRQFAAA